MQTLRILFFLLIVLIGVVALKQYIFPKATAPRNTTATGNKTRPTVTPLPKTVLKKSTVLEKTPTPKPTTLSTPTAAPQTQSSAMLGPYRYPGATVTSQSDSEIDMVSSDDPQAVTDWYKNVINGQGLHTTSFVQTSSNDNVLNKLAAGLDGGGQITVTITRSSGASTVSISVTISHS